MSRMEKRVASPARAAGNPNLKSLLENWTATGDSRSAARPIRMMQIPHIELARGVDTYRAAFSALRATTQPDIIYMFGVDHHGGRDSLFHFSGRPYVTPLGEVPTCEATLDVLRRKLGSHVFSNERLHDVEWTIENPLVWVQHALGKIPAFVPVIVSERRAMFARHGADGEHTQAVLNVLARQIATQIDLGKQVLLIAGVDLSHGGSAFSGQAPHSEEGARLIEQHDRAYLEALFRLDLAKSERIVLSNPTNIDAGAPMGAMQRLGEILGWTGGGALLHYDSTYWSEEDRYVTYASAYWT
ncbi:MAG: AmmeMemoRadiSam system protein B [Bdellovibrionota bacterium]